MDNDYERIGAMLAFWLLLPSDLPHLRIAGYVIGSFFLMRIFEKAGVQGKWRAWVPGLQPHGPRQARRLLAVGHAGRDRRLEPPQPDPRHRLDPLARRARPRASWPSWRVGLKLGKDWPYLLLWLIPGIGALIWLGILAFDKAPWNPNIAPSPWRNSFLKDTTVWQGIPVQPDAAHRRARRRCRPPTSPPAGYQPPAGGYQPPPAGRLRAAAARPPATRRRPRRRRRRPPPARRRRRRPRPGRAAGRPRRRRPEPPARRAARRRRSRRPRPKRPSRSTARRPLAPRRGVVVVLRPLRAG